MRAGVVVGIARRLSLGRDGKPKSVSVTIATVGVALAIAIMLLTLAITSGFKRQIRGVITGFDGEITITGMASGEGEVGSQGVFLDKGEISGIVGDVYPEVKVSGVVEFPSMLKTGNDFEAVMMRAYGADSDVDFLKGMISEGSPLVVDSIVSGLSDEMLIVSESTAGALQLSVGDMINALFFEGGNIRMRRLRIAATFDSGFSAFDSNVAFASKVMAGPLLGIGADDCGKIVLSGIDFEDIPFVEQAVGRRLSDAFLSGRTGVFCTAESVLSSSSNYFSWLELLDTNVVVIVALMGLIAIFTLTATLFIMILEKSRTIGTFKTMGASNVFVRKVFIAMMGRIVIRGLCWGNVAALSVIAVQGLFHLIPLNPEAYFVSFVPVHMSVWTILVVNLSAVAAALAAMILPSTLISRLSPASTVRFE